MTKHINYTISGIVALIFFLMFGFNVMAAHEGNIPYATDKSDRTILKEIQIDQKEIIANQKEMHTILKEVKALLQEEK